MKNTKFDFTLQWRVLVLCYFGIMAAAVSVQILPPVSHKVQLALGIDYGRLGFLIGAISIPGIFIALPGGYFADQWGSRRILIIGCICLVAGAVLFAVKPSYTLLCVARILSGIGSILFSALLPGLIAKYYSGKSLGTAMGIFNTGFPLGSIITLLSFGELGRKIGAFEVFWVPTVIAFLVMVLFILFLPEERTVSCPEKMVKSGVFSLKGFNVWLFGFIIMCANMSTMGYVAIAPSYFEIDKFPPSIIGLMLSSVLWGSLFLSPLTGYLTTYRNLGRTLIIVGCLVQGISLLVIPFKIVPLCIDLVFLAVSSGIILTPVYIYVSRTVYPVGVNVRYGVIIFAMMIGCLLGPSLAGISVDNLGGFEAGFVSLGIFSFMGMCIALVLRPGT